MKCIEPVLLTLFTNFYILIVKVWDSLLIARGKFLMSRNDNEVESYYTARAGEICFCFVIICLLIWGLYNYITTGELHFQWALMFSSILIFYRVKSFLLKKNKKQDLHIKP